MFTEEENKILEQFPEYHGEGAFVGTRDYWSSIFETETNRDTKLHEAFSKLHEEIVDKVIQFCKEHDLDVDEFVVSADGLLGSKDFGKWTCCTDSCMEMRVLKKDEETGMWHVDREGEPFLYEM